ncbi:hypothetical protein FGIG_06743 [Fasciola gigantica]|uniref:Uncharacterized protein n=1 Tax=Fasciola gigantica TaxID=46835 RepID=A0A504Z5K1_FASGI|nr:hypothetical protein FGIG_06743 [Fasciola gigantica]
MSYEVGAPHRLNSILLFTQIIWYLMREGVYWQATYAPPEIWPYEEKHAFWAGWGLPNNNYLTADPTNPSASSIGEGGVSRSSWFWILWDLFSIYSPVSVLLFFARSLLGLFLATSLLRASRVGRVVRFRDMQSRFSMVRARVFLVLLLFYYCQIFTSPTFSKSTNSHFHHVIHVGVTL